MSYVALLLQKNRNFELIFPSVKKIFKKLLTSERRCGTIIGQKKKNVSVLTVPQWRVRYDIFQRSEIGLCLGVCRTEKWLRAIFFAHLGKQRRCISY